MTVLLHRPDVRGVDRKQKIAVHLDMMRPCIRRHGHEGSRLWLARIANVDDADTVAEHVTDKGMTLVDHDLHAIGAPALVAQRQKADILRSGGHWSTLLCVRLTGDGRHPTRGGATCEDVRPMELNALRTKPEAFASSRKSLT